MEESSGPTFLLLYSEESVTLQLSKGVSKQLAVVLDNNTFAIESQG